MRHDKLEKELSLLRLLTENRHYDVDQLSERLGMSRRMIYYYIESFRDWGFIVEKHGRYYSLDRRSPFFLHLFETINFTEEEALTLFHLLNKVSDRNAITERLKHKLDIFYDLHILADASLREQVAHHVGILYDAIKGKRLVKIKDYSSPHSRSVSDRIVEPFHLMNNNNEVRCYELSSRQNKTFKVSRMGDVQLLDLNWSHEDKHKRLYTDLFMFSGEERYRVTLRLGQLSRNLLLEEYPLSERYLSPQDEDGRSLFETDVVSFLGIGRFVLGLYDDIEVLGDDSFLKYLNKKVKFMQKTDSL